MFKPSDFDAYTHYPVDVCNAGYPFPVGICSAVADTLSAGVAADPLHKRGMLHGGWIGGMGGSLL